MSVIILQIINESATSAKPSEEIESVQETDNATDAITEPDPLKKTHDVSTQYDPPQTKTRSMATQTSLSLAKKPKRSKGKINKLNQIYVNIFV